MIAYTAKKKSARNSKSGGTPAASTFGVSNHHPNIEVTNSESPPLLGYQTSTLGFRYGDSKHHIRLSNLHFGVLDMGIQNTTLDYQTSHLSFRYRDSKHHIRYSNLQFGF